MTIKASGMPVPGKLTDYMVEETSLVDYPANDRPFLVRKNAFTPEQIEELKAQGISPVEAPGFFEQMRSLLKSDILEVIKQFMAPTANQKGTDPMSEQLANEATVDKALTDADWNEIQMRIDAALAPWDEKFAALESRIAACEAPAAEAEPMEDACKPAEKEASAPVEDKTAVELAELKAMLKGFMNQRPVGQVASGVTPTAEPQKKSVFSGSVFEQIAMKA